MKGRSVEEERQVLGLGGRAGSDMLTTRLGAFSNLSQLHKLLFLSTSLSISGTSMTKNSWGRKVGGLKRLLAFFFFFLMFLVWSFENKALLLV